MAYEGGLSSFQGRDRKLETFLAKNQENNCVLWIFSGESLKIAHQLILLNEKKIRIIPLIFDMENWLTLDSGISVAGHLLKIFTSRFRYFFT